MMDEAKFPAAAVAQQPAEVLVEVRIEELTLLLPCDRLSTVSTLTRTAVDEFYSYQLGGACEQQPRKVLYTRDSQGRVLGGALRIVDHEVDRALEVVLQQFADVDPVKAATDVSRKPQLKMLPREAERLLRDWQFWAAVQLKDHIQQLSFQDVPAQPDEQSLIFLHELSQSPAEPVQLQALRALQLLMTKFPQRAVVASSAERICALFERTPHTQVAIEAIGAFRGLSPLQLQVLDGGSYLRAMFDVQRTLCRFSEEKRGLLYRAFESVAALLDDLELLKILAESADAFTGPDSQQQQAALGQQQQPEDFIEYELNRPSSAVALNPAVKSDAASAVMSPSRTSAAVSSSSTVATAAREKRINLKRLESLLLSDDIKIRQYALEKLLKLLLIASANINNANQLPVPPPQLATAVTAIGQGQSSRDIEKRVGSPMQQSQVALSPTPTAAATVNNEGANRGAASYNSDNSNVMSAHSDSRNVEEYGFTFADAMEVDSLVNCLCRCLKRCIHARQQQPIATALAVDGGGKGRRKSSSALPSPLQMKSTPARLIQSALQSPQSDALAAALAVDCLWCVVHFPSDLNANATLSSGSSSIGRQRLKMNGAVVTNIQSIFAVSCREWYRLLLTLSHADETSSGGSSSNTRSFAMMADKCAYMFQLVVLHAISGDWRSTGLKLEAAALRDFLQPRSLRDPSFRCYLALHFLLSLTAQLADSSSSDHRFPAVDNTHSKQQSEVAKDSSSSAAAELELVLQFDDHAVLHALWVWAVGNNLRRATAIATAARNNQSLSTSATVVAVTPHYHRKSSILALGCIASCCVFSSVHSVLLRSDPLAQLAKLLTTAVRSKESEQYEYSVAALSTSLSNVADGNCSRVDCFSDELLGGPQSTIHDDDDFFVEVAAEDDDHSSDGGGENDHYDDDGSRSSDSDNDSAARSDGGNAMSRFLTRHVQQGEISKQQQQQSAALTAARVRVYPDLPLIRQALKCMCNLLLHCNAVSAEYRRRVASWLTVAEVAAPGNQYVVSSSTATTAVAAAMAGSEVQRQHTDSASTLSALTAVGASGSLQQQQQQQQRGVKLRRIVAKDPLSAHYFALLTQQLQS